MPQLRTRIAALDGLRGVAITVGFPYHLPDSPWPAGAMAVIDMFFVLSGFLIGTILLNQAVAGRIDLPRFWAARVRRLFPAIGAMLLIWGLIAWWVASPSEWDVWRYQVAWASWYAENFYLIATENNYFVEGRDSPFVHMWSLAVEEQFYLLFPFLVLLAMGVFRLLRRFGVRAILAVFSLTLAAASWTYGQVVFDPDNTALAYYDLRAHASGLLAGVFLACVYDSIAGYLEKRPRLDRSLQLCGILALVVIVSATLSSDTPTMYQRFGAPLTVLGTLLLVIVAQRPGRASKLLSWKPLAFTGVISYGIYVWAGGIVIIIGNPLVTRDGLPAWAVWTVCWALSWGIAALSWKFLEMPIRSSRKLALYPKSTVVAGVASLALLGLFFYNLPSRGSFAPPQPTLELGSTAIPDCDDQKNETGGKYLGCYMTDEHPDPERTILVIGNSVARFLQPGISTMANERKWRVLAVTVDGCPIGELTFDHIQEAAYIEYGCHLMAPAIEKVLATNEVDTVVAIDMVGVGAFATGDRAGKAEAVYRDLFASWSKYADVVVVEDYRTLDPPGSESLRVDNSDEAKARSHIKASAALEETRRIVRAAAEGLDRVRLLDVDPVVCPEGWPCPESIDGVTMRVDQIHFTEVGGRIVADLIGDFIEQVFPAPSGPTASPSPS